MKKTAKKLSRTDILTYVSERLADVIVYEQIGSTNTEARRMLAEGKPTPFLLAAMSQTAGRGRRGNTFFSPESGLYMTLALKPDEYKSAIARTTIAAAVSLYEAILETTGIVCGIKWVNDLYFEQKKIAGILCEAPRGTSGQPLGILIGIGVNVAQKEFPDDPVDDLSLPARFPPYAKRVIDDHHGKDRADGKHAAGKPLPDTHRDRQGDHRGGMRRRHAPAAENALLVKALV